MLRERWLIDGWWVHSLSFSLSCLSLCLFAHCLCACSRINPRSYSPRHLLDLLPFGCLACFCLFIRGGWECFSSNYTPPPHSGKLYSCCCWECLREVRMLSASTPTISWSRLCSVQNSVASRRGESVDLGLMYTFSPLSSSTYNCKAEWGASGSSKMVLHNRYCSFASCESILQKIVNYKPSHIINSHPQHP